jgi:predicted PurR-regulated permease PerM
MTYVGLVIIGVPFPLVLGVLAGLGELVPIAGPIFASIPAIGLALLDSPLKAGIVMVFYIAIQQLEGHILVPSIVGRQANIPPILAIFAILAGAALGGILGALIAIPIAGALRVLILRVVAPEIRRWTGADRAPVTAADE